MALWLIRSGFRGEHDQNFRAHDMLLDGAAWVAAQAGASPIRSGSRDGDVRQRALPTTQGNDVLRLLRYQRVGLPQIYLTPS